MTHRRSRLRRLAAFAAVALFAFGAVHAALAFGRHRDMKARIGQHVAEALDAVKATPAQRNQVQAAVGEVARTADEAFGQGMPDLDEVLDLFSRDRLDARAIDALKQKREARHKKLADALTQAFYDVHDALTREQRQQLLDYAHGRTEGRHMRAFKQKLIGGLVNAQVEDVLDQLGADERERGVVHAAVGEVVGAIQQAQAGKQATIEALSAIFRGDTVDKAALQRFRADKEAQLSGLADVIQRAIVELHDGLSSEHRQKLVQLVRARHARMHAAPHGDEGF